MLLTDCVINCADMVVLQSGKNGYFCFSGLRYFFHSQCPFAWSNLISLLLRYLIILEARMFHVDSYNVVQFTNSSKITDSDKYAEYQEAIFQGAIVAHIIFAGL